MSKAKRGQRQLVLVTGELGIGKTTLIETSIATPAATVYRRLNGAGGGDLFMSLIHTCELNGANSFHYLTELQRHAPEVAANPGDWMPWNYRQPLERAAGP